ncbi:MAG TPA: DUF1702 domain-containing protein [Herpetosiphon sp.]|uniref:DUF1702 family protein n=1 Tax=Herpetosiphon aurantiacus (strain ATCC 23779 / DSM 785 / 114-95) TaxID=316274 RepID=A9AYD5_HERA2|nr:DUF1702 family protein [Herpetosiphon sp.]ABX03517.1 protein of unknown function DUF1702 [Herpetosiphon aurantiacus DSM 785]HBW51757.1 DUF1702 domain-containing protein [Herpetosiphon sp.]
MLLNRVLTYPLRLSPLEATFARRGFPIGDRQNQARLETIGKTFLHGYHAALDNQGLGQLKRQLEQIDPQLQGFGFEGTGMGLAILDQITPWKGQRVQAFLANEGQHQRYVIHVGVGWAVARMRWTLPKVVQALDPILRWLVLDGYGFHQGYFAWHESFIQQHYPQKFDAKQLAIFDQGLGRSLWFVTSSNPRMIANVISRFAQERQINLWAGVGLACTYAGSNNPEALHAIAELGATYSTAITQGVSFAAKTRLHAGYVPEHSELACQILCQQSVAEAAAITDQQLLRVNQNGSIDSYHHWQELIRACYLKKEAIAV